MKYKIFLLAAMVLLASCSKKTADSVSSTSDSSVVSPSASSSKAVNNLVSQINDNRTTADALSANVNVTLEYNGKDISVGGNLKMKRNDCIQISLSVIVGIEVGRREMTPDYVLLVNRLGKQYVKATYAEVPFFQRNNIDFYTFQSLLWNELFTPGDKGSKPKGSDFTMSKEGGKVKLSNKSKQIAIQFLADETRKLVSETSISTSSNTGKMVCNYNSWTPIDKKQFPDNLSVQVSAGTMSAKATLAMSKLRTLDNWKDNRTQVSGKYTQINLKQALAQIMSLAR